jgi:hypothetical protein
MSPEAVGDPAPVRCPEPATAPAPPLGVSGRYRRGGVENPPAFQPKRGETPTVSPTKILQVD